MRPNVQVRVFRPRQVILATGKPHNTKRGVLASNQGKYLGWMVAVTFAIGLGLTQFLQVRMVALQAKVDQLHISNTAIVEENKRLMATETQVASETQVIALAKRKLHLFEPDHRQVRRM